MAVEVHSPKASWEVEYDADSVLYEQHAQRMIHFLLPAVSNIILIIITIVISLSCASSEYPFY